MASETPATASQLLEALDQGRCSAEELVRDFRDLRLRLKREGLFESNKVFYVYKTSTTFALVAVGAYVLAAQVPTRGVLSKSKEA